MTEYIVEQSKDRPDDWNVLIGERVEGPFRSLEVANSWAVWFALRDLESFLLDKRHEIYKSFAQKVSAEAESLEACIENHLVQDPCDSASMAKLTAEYVKFEDNYHSLFEEAKISITLAELPAPEQKSDSMLLTNKPQTPQTPEKRESRWKLGGD